MKLKNLIEEVYALGFEEVSDVGALFYTSARRALRSIFSEYPRERSMRLFIKPEEYEVVSEEFTHDIDSSESFALSGSAFSFRACGEGMATVTDNAGSREYRFCSLYESVVGELYGNARIEFSGDAAFRISELITLPSLRFSDIRNHPAVMGELRLEMHSLTKDFLSFSRVPTDEAGKPPAKLKITIDTIILPWDFVGEINIFYNSAPSDIDPDNQEGEIDIPPPLEHLLPLLCAAYMWLDDSPDNAEYYMSLYREAMGQIKKELRQNMEHDFTDVLGWA